MTEWSGYKWFLILLTIILDHQWDVDWIPTFAWLFPGSLFLTFLWFVWEIVMLAKHALTLLLWLLWEVWSPCVKFIWSLGWDHRMARKMGSRSKSHVFLPIGGFIRAFGRCFPFIAGYSHWWAIHVRSCDFNIEIELFWYTVSRCWFWY